MTDIPNLDGMSQDELLSFIKTYEKSSRATAEALVGRRNGYTLAAKALVHYAWNRRTAMQCRERGSIQAALMYENIAERIYHSLPSDCRW